MNLPPLRIEELEQWLQREYEAAYAVWRATGDPFTAARTYTELQVLTRVARHLITGQDGPVSVMNDRFIIFTRHLHLPTCALRFAHEGIAACTCGMGE